MLRFILRDAGFQVEAVGTGGAALDRLDRAPVDAVVLDLGLPDERGPAVLARLRELEANDGSTAHPAWVVITAQDRADVTARFGPLGGRFLSKPFDPWDLVHLLQASVR